MSIAAAIKYKDGVLICADTEQSTWTHTTHESKIKKFECPGGKVALAYAGNTAFSLSAMQKCAEHLQHINPQDALQELETTLEDEYRRHVLSHPDHLSDGNLAYRLLVGFWSPGNRAR